MQVADYDGIARWLDGAIRRYKRSEGNILLDLACGSGSLSLRMQALGYDVIGVEESPEMLSQAMAKGAGSVLFLCQPLAQLDLYGTVDVCVSTLDSLSHITDRAVLQRVLGRVSLFLDPGGVFIFDVNTVYKHRERLAGQTFVYDLEDVYCVWQNSLRADGVTVDIDLDFFIEDAPGCYRRTEEHFSERAYTLAEWSAMLAEAGLVLDAAFDDYSDRTVSDRTERLVLICTKAPVN